MIQVTQRIFTPTHRGASMQYESPQIVKTDALGQVTGTISLTAYPVPV